MSDNSSGTTRKTEKKQRMLTNAQIFQFFEQLRTLIAAGITPHAALEIMQKDGSNAKILPLLTWMSDQLETGRHLSDVVRDAGVFPSYVCELLVIGEQTGNVENVCGALAQYYADEDELAGVAGAGKPCDLVGRRQGGTRGQPDADAAGGDGKNAHC